MLGWPGSRGQAGEAPVCHEAGRKIRCKMYTIYVSSMQGRSRSRRIKEECRVCGHHPYPVSQNTTPPTPRETI